MFEEKVNVEESTWLASMKSGSLLASHGPSEPQQQQEAGGLKADKRLGRLVCGARETSKEQDPFWEL